MDKENIEVKCPNCGQVSKAANMTSIMSARLQQCQGCKIRIGVDETSLDAAAEAGRTEINGFPAPTGMERNNPEYVSAREKATQAQQDPKTSDKSTGAPANPPEETKPVSSSAEGAGPTSRETQSQAKADAGALVLDAQARARAADPGAKKLEDSAPKEAPDVVLDAMERAKAVDRENEDCENPLMHDALQRAGASATA